MNRAFPLTYFGILLLLLACNRHTANPPEDILEVSKQNVTLGPKNSNDTLAIASNTSWNITIPADAPWITTSTSTGSGDDIIIIYAAESNTGAARSANIIISTISGAKSFTIHVNQPTTDFVAMAALGGEGDDTFNSFIETTDGDFIAVGQTFSKAGDIPDNEGGLTRLWIARFDDKGVVKWSKVFGHGAGISITKRPAGGYIVLAHAILEQASITTFTDDIDTWLLAIDENGNVLWEKLIGGSRADELRSIKQLSDGNFILGGSTSSDDHDVSVNDGYQHAWVVKIDAQGEIIWEKTYIDDGGMDAFTAVTPISTGGFAFCGWHLPGVAPSQTAGWYGLLDDDGNITRTEAIYQPTGLNTVIEAKNGDIILAGWDAFLGNYYREAAIIRLDPSGNLKWNKKYGGTGDDAPRSAMLTSDDRIILAGLTNSNDGDFAGNPYGIAAMLMEIDSEGNLVKTKTISGGNEDYANKLIQIASGEIAFVGMTKSYPHKYPNLANLANGWFVVSDF